MVLIIWVIWYLELLSWNTWKKFFRLLLDCPTTSSFALLHQIQTLIQGATVPTKCNFYHMLRKCCCVPCRNKHCEKKYNILWTTFLLHQCPYLIVHLTALIAIKILCLWDEMRENWWKNYKWNLPKSPPQHQELFVFWRMGWKYSY